MEKIFKQYAQIGLLTFIPIIISGYYVVDVFENYCSELNRRNIIEEFDISKSYHQEMLIGGFVFLFIFFAFFIGTLSSSLYISAHLKQKEKWLLWGHKLRIVTWVPIILCGLILLGLFSMVVIRES